MEVLINLGAYFIIYSFLGWILESIFKTILEKKIINSGFLIGPFCPIYGFGAIIMYLFLEQASGKPILTFCLGFVILSFWEYVVGIFLEKIFNTKYWDYSENKFNLQGRVCLTNSIFWGLLSIIFIDLLHPIIVNLVSKIDYTVLVCCVAVISIYLMVDFIISTIKVIGLKDQLAKIEKINEAIKEKLETIKQKGKELKNIEINTENIQEAIEHLKKQRDKLVIKTYKNVHRLKKAFPSMKSEIVTKFLTQSKELLKIDRKKEKMKE